MINKIFIINQQYNYFNQKYIDLMLLFINFIMFNIYLKYQKVFLLFHISMII